MASVLMKSYQIEQKPFEDVSQRYRGGTHTSVCLNEPPVKGNKRRTASYSLVEAAPAAHCHPNYLEVVICSKTLKSTATFG